MKGIFTHYTWDTSSTNFEANNAMVRERLAQADVRLIVVLNGALGEAP